MNTNRIKTRVCDEVIIGYDIFNQSYPKILGIAVAYYVVINAVNCYTICINSNKNIFDAYSMLPIFERIIKKDSIILTFEKFDEYYNKLKTYTYDEIFKLRNKIFICEKYYIAKKILKDNANKEDLYVMNDYAYTKNNLNIDNFYKNKEKFKYIPYASLYKAIRKDI